jgi:uncharacterized protein YcbX
MMASLTLSGLYRYPVKSMRGAAFDELTVGPRGLVNDRQWMLVDERGRFLTQRQLPRMALMSAEFDEVDGLVLGAPGMGECVVRDTSSEVLDVTVWRDTLTAVACDPAADAWCSDFLERPCRLVRLAADTVRTVDQNFAAAADQVGFADGFPFLLISQASLDDLNRRIGQTLPMQRFRPNLVVEGCAPYAEDGWRRLRIGDITFRVAKPCSRCIIPTIDPLTAERAAEPLRTLMSYRRRDNQVFFGQNLLHDGTGKLRVGMTVEPID